MGPAKPGAALPFYPIAPREQKANIEGYNSPRGERESFHFLGPLDWAISLHPRICDCGQAASLTEASVDPLYYENGS